MAWFITYADNLNQIRCGGRQSTKYEAEKIAKGRRSMLARQQPGREETVEVRSFKNHDEFAKWLSEQNAAREVRRVEVQA